MNECLINVKLLPFNFFHSSFSAVEHGLQVTDVGLILYNNGNHENPSLATTHQ